MDTALEKISGLLKKSRIPVVTFPSGNKGSVMFLPAYGRVIGLWSDRVKENHFWVNPAFLDRRRAGSSDWTNPGGDRLWLSPEREFFINDLNRPWETYSVPACLDPGNYFYKTDGDNICLENSGVATAFASKLSIPFKVLRKIHPFTGREIASFFGQADAKGAGYEEKTDLVIDKPCPIEIGVWNLVQVCCGGTVMVPVKHERYTVFFGNPEGALTFEKDWLEASFKSKRMYKIGLKASWGYGRMFYLKDNNNGSGSLLIRIFPIREDADYADTPWSNPKDIGYATQIFCGTKTHGFGELEYHAPAIGGASGRLQCRTRGLLFAFDDSMEKLWKIVSAVPAAYSKFIRKGLP